MILPAIVAILFAIIPFIGAKSLMVGIGVMTIALGLLDVINERRGLIAAQSTVAFGLIMRCGVYGAAFMIGLVNHKITSLFIAGLWALGVSQILFDIPLFAALKEWMPKTRFLGRNILSNIVSVTIFALMAGGSGWAVLGAISMRVGYSIIVSPLLLWVLRLVPAAILLLATPAIADMKTHWNLRFTEPQHYEALLTVRVDRGWVQNMTLVDPGALVSWNTKTTIGFDVLKTKWFTVAGIGQHQTWETPRQRETAWRYGIEIRSK